MQQVLGKGAYFISHRAYNNIKSKFKCKQKSLELANLAVELAAKHKSFSWLYSLDSPFLKEDVEKVKRFFKNQGLSHIIIPDKAEIKRMENPFGEYFN